MKTNKTRKILAGALCTCAIMASLTAHAFAAETVYLEPREVTEELLTTRTPDTVIVEKVVGIVANDAGDGTIINARDPEYSYISYSGLGFQPLDIILSLETYNPNTTYTDDVITRQDFRIGSLRDFVAAPSLTGIVEDAFIRRFEELPRWAQPEMREILDAEYVNGGTDYAEDPDDINMYMSDIKTLLATFRMTSGSRHNQYPAAGTVSEIRDDTVYVTDSTGNIWSFDGAEDWQTGDQATMLMDDNGTETIYDDEILQVRYVG